ncbi:MAG: NADH-quinone oxidoreductase subunit L, partial [Anaerolineales bacterium]|nr:NADH-quinone oxidoreductase subunit L [Anaerolineales bacterium]
ASILVIINFVITLTLMSSLAAHDYHAEIVPLWDWFAFIGDFHIPWAMQIDTLSVTMLAVITGVGALIHIYAIGYMHGDEGFARFFAYLNLFIFFMIILVTGNNYLMLFVGWEGVGLCSFLLIGFWFDRKHGVGLANSRAARKAFIANRVGDAAMILAMILTFWVFGTLEFEPVFAHAIEMFEAHEEIMLFGMSFQLGAVLSAITALFLIGATGKSAQLPLYIWLPDAMAGPTPVSALIHAATMVTSGIYLIVRSNVLFEIVRESNYLLFNVISTNDLVALIGASTALWAGLIAFTQWDVKKVLAYSTVSQLGFMIAAVGMGAYVAGMFHLITHALFKALLFMGSGSIIHGMEHGHHHYLDHHGGHGDDHHGGHDDFDPQDMRTMGGLRHKMPWTFWTYIVGTLALAGIFPFAGFWSKDEILAHASWNQTALAGEWIYPVVYVLLTLAAFCTAFYMGRQIKMVFFGEPRSEVV